MHFSKYEAAHIENVTKKADVLKNLRFLREKIYLIAWKNKRKFFKTDF